MRINYDNENEIPITDSMLNSEDKTESQKPKPKPITFEEEGIALLDRLPQLITFDKEQKKILRALFCTNSIPEENRKDIWFILSGAKRELTNNPNYYFNLVNNFPDYIPQTMENQIELDLHRTFPNDPFFKKEDNLHRLKNLLLAYAKRNIIVGYCQGFNFIGAYFLKLYDDEEKAFWILSVIFENILPPDFFVALCGLMADTNMLLDIIRMQYSVFKDKHQLYFFNTIITVLANLFVKDTNSRTKDAFFDYIFLDGLVALYRVVLYLMAIFKEYNENIGMSLDYPEYSQYNTDVMSNLSNEEIMKFRATVFNPEIPFEFSLSTLMKMRKNQIVDVLDDIMSNKKTKEALNDKLRIKNSFITQVDDCNLDWPLCIYDRKYRFEYCEFFVYKVLEEPDVIDDFYFTHRSWSLIEDDSKPLHHVMQKEKEEIKKFDIYKDLLIERRKHLCDSTKENSLRVKFKQMKDIQEEEQKGYLQRAKNKAMKMSKLFEQEHQEIYPKGNRLTFASICMEEGKKFTKKDVEKTEAIIEDFLKENNPNYALTTSIDLGNEKEK